MKDRYVVFHPNIRDELLRPHSLLPDVSLDQLNERTTFKNVYGEELVVGIRMRIKPKSR